MFKEDYIYMDATIRMSKESMANFLYAIIITKSGIPTSYGVGIYEYNRSQNSYNNVEIKVHIHPSKVEQFELHSKTKLREPIKISLNSN